jgi:purine-binding chemotaxis protein CheW
MKSAHPDSASHPERAERLLIERARHLAREKDPEAERAEVEWLTFWVSEQLFGIPLSLSEGVAPLGKVLSVPGAPAYLLGLVRMQGKFIALIELRQLLVADLRGLADGTKVVAVRVGERVLGLAASDVHDVLSLAEAQISAARVASDGLSRAVTIKGESVALIDPHALVRDPRLTGVLNIDQRGKPITTSAG